MPNICAICGKAVCSHLGNTEEFRRTLMASGTLTIDGHDIPVENVEISFVQCTFRRPPWYRRWWRAVKRFFHKETMVETLRRRVREDNFMRKITPPAPLVPPDTPPRWLGVLNFVVLQWTCFRLAMKTDFFGKKQGWKMVGPWLPLTRWRWR